MIGVYTIRIGGIIMANIYEFVKKTSNRRPAYTKYELSKMVRDKRKTCGLSISQFAVKYGISEKELEEIEIGDCSFSPRIYKVCGNILNLSVEELLAEYIDDDQAASYRASGSGTDVQATFDMANMFFNEIIMQKKISVN